MGAANKGLQWVGDASPDRMGWASARNTVAQVIADEPDVADGIMWIDSDIRVPADGIVRLLAHNLDFVTGVYHQRLPLHNPVFYGWNDDKKMFQPADDYPVDTLAPTDGCGFGIVWTSTKLILAIAGLNEFDEGGWFKDARDAGGLGEDLQFCHYARKAGFQLYVDTGVQAGHCGELHVVTREDFLREREANKANVSSPQPKRKYGLNKEK